MKKMEIRERIKEDLKVGGLLERGYMKEFNRLYHGSARAIDTFNARYGDDGLTVVFTITINGKSQELVGNIPNWKECNN